MEINPPKKSAWPNPCENKRKHALFKRSYITTCIPELEKKERELALREKTLAVVCNDNLQISDHLAKHGTSK
jgi:hypothetical protein